MDEEFDEVISKKVSMGSKIFNVDSDDEASCGSVEAIGQSPSVKMDEKFNDVIAKKVSMGPKIFNVDSDNEASCGSVEAISESSSEIFNRHKTTDSAKDLWMDITKKIDLKRSREGETENLSKTRRCIRDLFMSDSKESKRCKANCSLEDPKDREIECDNPGSNSKRWRFNFSHEEKAAVVSYVFKQKEFGLLKGNSFWVAMERKKICPGRTWQSLRNHFLRCSVKNLSDFNIPQEDLNLFKKVFGHQTPVNDAAAKLSRDISQYYRVKK